MAGTLSNVSVGTAAGDITSDDFMTVSPMMQTFRNVSLGFAVVIAVFGNAAAIVAFVYDRGLRDKPSNMLILALSCSDLCVGLLLSTTTLGIFLSPRWVLGEIGCRIFTSIGDLIIPLGPLLVAAICLDRYLLVSRDYPRYLAIQTRRSVRLTIGLCWALTAVLCIVENILWDASPSMDTINYSKDCFSPNVTNVQFNQFANIVYALLPFVFVTGCSVRFLVLLRGKLKGRGRVGPQVASFRTRSVQAARRQPSSDLLTPGAKSISEFHEPSLDVCNTTVTTLSPTFQAFSFSEVDPRSQLLKSRYVRPTVTVICLVAALALCYLPYCIYSLLVVAIFPQCASPQLHYTLHLLRLYNSSLDPILYAATQRRIRAFYAKHLRHIWSFIRTRAGQKCPGCGY